jgi:bifunctional DNase/RNase
MADMLPVTITGVVRGSDDGPGRCERFFVELAAAAEGDARRLRIGVGDAEAAALAFSLRGTAFPRPMTYQFTASLVTAAGSAVRSVRVTDLRDGIFYAQVMLRGGATVDARPSDALNLAAVTGAPVFVAETLLGVPADLGEPSSQPGLLAAARAAFEERGHPVVFVLGAEQECLGRDVEGGCGGAVGAEGEFGEFKGAPGLAGDLSGEGGGRG